MNQFLSSRRVRSVKVTSERWQRRAVFVLGGVVIGAVAVALAMLADWAQLAFSALIAQSRYAFGYTDRFCAIGIPDQSLLSQLARQRHPAG
jgi:hypothetical protein